MKTKVQFDEEIKKIRETLRGEEIFSYNANDVLSKVYVPAEAAAIKARSNLKKVYELHRQNSNSEQPTNTLNIETVRMAYEYTDVYLRTIRKLNAKYKTSLIMKVRNLLSSKARSLNDEYLRKIYSVRNEVTMPDFLTKEFREKGWIIHYDENCKDNGYFYLLKNATFKLKKFCGNSGFMSNLPDIHQKTIRCLLGFTVRYNANNKTVDNLTAFEKNMNNLQTFHTNGGRVCLGETEQLRVIADTAIKSGDFEKLDQIITDLEDMLTIINMTSAHTPKASLIPIRSYVKTKLRENNPDSEDGEDDDVCPVCGEHIDDCDCDE